MKKIIKRSTAIVLATITLLTMIPLLNSTEGTANAVSSVTYSWPGDPDKLYASGGAYGRWGDIVPGHKRSSHYGQDFSFNCSRLDVVAAADGTVVKTEYESQGYGHYVLIEHSNKQITLYGHLTGKTISEGAKVKKGQKIGYMNSGESTGFVSGTCLHFGIYKNIQAKQNEYHGYKASQISYDPLDLLVKCTKHTINTKTGRCITCGTPYTEWDLKQDGEKWNTAVESNKEQFYRTKGSVTMRTYPKTGSKVVKLKRNTGIQVFAMRNKWYKVMDSKGNVGYVPQNKVKKIKVKSAAFSKLKIKMNKSSYKTMTEGTSRFITGSVNSNYPIDYISVVVLKKDETVSIRTHYFDQFIYKSVIVDDSWKFVRLLNLNELSAGEYIVRIAARDVSGKAKLLDNKLIVTAKAGTAQTGTSTVNTADGFVRGSVEYLVSQAKHYKGMTLAEVKKEIKAQGFNGYLINFSGHWCAWYLSNCANASFVGNYPGMNAISKGTYVDDLANSFAAFNETGKMDPSSYNPKAGDIVVERNEGHIGIMISDTKAAYGNAQSEDYNSSIVEIREPRNITYYVPAPDWYQIHYSDDITETSPDEDMAYNAPYKVKFGEKKKTSTKKFKRSEYDYSCYYIFQERYNKETGKYTRYFWSKNSSTGKRAWVKSGTKNYTKIKTKVGSELWFGYNSSLAGAKVILIPVWTKK